VEKINLLLKLQDALQEKLLKSRRVREQKKKDKEQKQSTVIDQQPEVPLKMSSNIDEEASQLNPVESSKLHSEALDADKTKEDT